MTLEQGIALLLAVGPIYLAMFVAFVKFLQQRQQRLNGTAKTGDGKHNPSAEHHRLADEIGKLSELVSTLDRARSEAQSTTRSEMAVLTEKVGRIDKRTEEMGRRLHRTETQITALNLVTDWGGKEKP